MFTSDASTLFRFATPFQGSAVGFMPPWRGIAFALFVAACLLVSFIEPLAFSTRSKKVMGPAVIAIAAMIDE